MCVKIKYLIMLYRSGSWICLSFQCNCIHITFLIYRYVHAWENDSHAFKTRFWPLPMVCFHHHHHQKHLPREAGALSYTLGTLASNFDRNSNPHITRGAFTPCGTHSGSKAKALTRTRYNHGRHYRGSSLPDGPVGAGWTLRPLLT